MRITESQLRRVVKQMLEEQAVAGTGCEAAKDWLTQRGYRFRPAAPDSGYDFYVVNSSLNSDERGYSGGSEKLEIAYAIKNLGCVTSNPLSATMNKGKPLYAVFFKAKQ